MPQVVIQKVTEADSHLVLRVNLQSDGTGELENYQILKPSDLVPPRANNKAAFRLMQAWWGLVWFDVSLSVGTVSPTALWTLTRDTDSHVDFRGFGGLVDLSAYTAPPSEDSGILTISTNGFILGSRGTFVLELRKTS